VRRQPIVQVDAFTDHPFAGNPAAVCLLTAPADPTWMQQVAREMNLAETAFLVPQADGYSLRWFTPSTEVDLCGHATLASAHVLWEDRHLRSDEEGRFHTRSGLLTASKSLDLIWLDFPATPPERLNRMPELESALGSPVRTVARTRFDYLAELTSPSAIRELQPDLAALSRLSSRGVVVTAAGGADGYDFISRFFAPAAGVPEDPVTGSTHCALGPFWGARLGKQELVGYQASERGGVVRVRLEGERVRLGGGAVTVLRGELLH
jgi:predicted PhzF superfamily epimerase YddE/YHI9